MAPTWQEAKQKYTEEFNQSIKTAWTASQEFWKHLVMVEATILGLSVGLLGGTDHIPSMPLVLSWVCLLLAIAAGSALVKIAIDAAFDGAVRGFRMAADVADLMTLVDDGKLDQNSDDFRRLFTAAQVRGTPENPWTDEAKRLAAQYESQLPTSFLNVPRRTPLARWLHARWAGLETVFYALSVLAFAFLLTSILSARAVGSGPAKERPASPAPHPSSSATSLQPRPQGVPAAAQAVSPRAAPAESLQKPPAHAAH